MQPDGDVPNGFPKAAAGARIPARPCTTSSTSRRTIKVPANAQGFPFDFDFYSGEWPEYVCTDFNDSFVAWLRPPRSRGRAAMPTSPSTPRTTRSA